MTRRKLLGAVVVVAVVAALIGVEYYYLTPSKSPGLHLIVSQDTQQITIKAYLKFTQFDYKVYDGNFQATVIAPDGRTCAIAVVPFVKNSGPYSAGSVQWIAPTPSNSLTMQSNESVAYSNTFAQIAGVARQCTVPQGSQVKVQYLLNINVVDLSGSNGISLTDQVSVAVGV